MLDLSALPGNENIKEILKGHAFHAYLIDGGSEEDRRTLARIISMSFICSGETKPCGKCKGCLKYLSDNHPDIIKIDGSLNIKQMREVLDGIYLSPNDGDTKVYIIENADALSAGVQNVLLKSIEEPPKHVVFILICVTKSALLATVRSRCTSLSLFSEKTGQAIENSKVYPECLHFCDSVYRKSFSQALDSFKFKNREEQREFILTAAFIFKKRLSEEIKNHSDEKMKKLNSICGIFDDILQKTELNVNINLWNTYILMKCMQVMNAD